jgi:NTP pyrophosphatase (non-canonical NTP hydrolase)
MKIFDHTDEPNQHMLTRYRDFVDVLFQSKREGNDGFIHPAVGMAGESAEVLDHMKKLWVYDRPMDREKVMEEMGDTFHYFVMMLIKLDTTLIEVIQNNVAKLTKRYPNGFTKADAIARADKVAA